MGRQIRPARVFQTAKKNLMTRRTEDTAEASPPWLPVLEAIPPTEALTRVYPVQLHGAAAKAPRRLGGGSRKIFRPPRIEFVEDRLRSRFYRDHPWELARPRVILELDGKDARWRDWSRGLEQPGMQLSGENVVQRQLWMMENEGKEESEAYDTVRREFYTLRHQEEIDRRIAVEEARMVGAYFGKTPLQVSMDVEDTQFENWKKWAGEEATKIETERNAAYTSFGNEDSREEALEAEEAQDKDVNTAKGS